MSLVSFLFNSTRPELTNVSNQNKLSNLITFTFVVKYEIEQPFLQYKPIYPNGVVMEYSKIKIDKFRNDRRTHTSKRK